MLNPRHRGRGFFTEGLKVEPKAKFPVKAVAAVTIPVFFINTRRLMCWSFIYLLFKGKFGSEIDQIITKV